MSTDESNQPFSRLQGLKPEHLHAMCKQAAAQVQQSDARMGEIEGAFRSVETLPDFEPVRKMLSEQLGFEMSPKDVLLHLLREKAEQLEAKPAPKG